MKHLGDITKISGFTAPVVDIITGGSPCQDLSVAGKRAGLAGERSGLFMDQIRIIKEMRENDKRSGRPVDSIRPRFMVWENVPGAFSSNKGEDFRAVLEETARIAKEDAVIPGLEGGEKWRPAGCIMGDGWSIAWRVHDAQFWGVPQRRKRIALVADFGGRSAPEILFERKGLSGDIAQSGKEGERVATDAERIVGKTSKAIGFHLTQDPVSTAELSYACSCGNSKSGQCVNGVVYGIGGYNSKGMLSNNPNSGIYEAETARTLDLNGRSPACNQGGMAVVSMQSKQQSMETSTETSGTLGANDYKEPQVVCIEGNGQPMVMDTYQKTTGSLLASGYSKLGTQEVSNDMYVVQSNWDGGQVSPTLTKNNANGGQRMPDKDNFNAVIAYGLDRASFNQGQNAKYDFSIEEEKIGAQVARGPGAICKSVVRRLTPLECERLQGFPDNWTDIGDWVDSKGKKHKGDSDSARYKALGNSIALPFWQWMAERMCRYIENPTMASLFDGIGGFPLVYSRCGCVPVWASEIEEFPVAVTKKRFGDE